MPSSENFFISINVSMFMSASLNEQKMALAGTSLIQSTLCDLEEKITLNQWWTKY